MPSDMMLCVISYWVLSGAKRRQIQQLRCCAFPAKLLKRRNVYLKLTRHNGRAGTHGTYNPKHNDRSFNLANSEHIDPERAKGNIYWDCFHGFRSALDPQDPDDLAATFSEVERQFYESRYSNFREYASHRLDDVLNKFLKTMQTTAVRLQEKLLKPEVRQKGKEQVKEKARDSVLQLLNRLQAEQAQRVPGEQHTAEKSETRGDVY